MDAHIHLRMSCTLQPLTLTRLLQTSPAHKLHAETLQAVVVRQLALNAHMQLPSKEKKEEGRWLFPDCMPESY